MDETERRLVRTGVLVGNAGGSLVETWERVVSRDKEGRIGVDSTKVVSCTSSFSFPIVWVCLSRFSVATFKVLSLATLLRAIRSSFCTTPTCVSLGGVEGVEGVKSEDAEWYVTSDASDETDIGCAARRVGAGTRAGDSGREPAGVSTFWTCVFRAAVNQGWATICAIVSRFEGSD